MSRERRRRRRLSCLGAATESRRCGESLSRIERQAPFDAALWVAAASENSKVSSRNGQAPSEYSLPPCGGGLGRGVALTHQLKHKLFIG
jgi:hypothetical protein